MSIWTDHGTKILGYGAAAVGSVAATVLTVDPALIASLAGPKAGAYFALAVAIFGGAVAKRGHTNTANQNSTQEQ